MQLAFNISKTKRHDSKTAHQLFETVSAHPELHAISQQRNVVIFRFIPGDYFSIDPGPYLNCINEEILNRIEDGREDFVSNAIIDNKYCLRIRLEKSKSQPIDNEALVELVTRTGRAIRKEWKERELKIKYSNKPYY